MVLLVTGGKKNRNRSVAPMTHITRNERRRYTVRGIVQGVGFRPFVYRIAQEHHLAGLVTNSTEGVVIEVEGAPPDLDNFQADLKNKAPSLAMINGIKREVISLTWKRDFVIQPSGAAGPMATLIAPDIAMCRDCQAEFFDTGDRRYLYPFINCTQCGPRYTITENVPYDRPFTSMGSFTMCRECQAEYDDPASRRFHAQPNACPECGPQVEFWETTGISHKKKKGAVFLAGEALGNGKIVAVKGLGGFHLAVNAINQDAVQRLRLRKGRREKPFAVMAANLEIARRLCRLGQEDEELLTSPAAPIVLAPKREGNGLAEAVAPNNHLLGIMLPYTPLHHLLFREKLDVLVMTSANLSEEPLCSDNQEALARLKNIADFFLLHNRDIFISNDDSVVIRLAGVVRPFRRSRGYVPVPIQLAETGPPVLAVGGELKNTVCLLKEDQAFVSQHLGDLKNLEGHALFKKTIDHLTRIFSIEPELVVHDLHPAYLSGSWALEEQDRPCLAVQHHHAHLAACLAENQHPGPAIGLIMDGTGYGSDGTIWGGEVLIGGIDTFDRYASFDPMPLPGGDKAVHEPWRCALGYLYAEFDLRVPNLPFLDGKTEAAQVLEILDKDLNCPRTTSCGRLFDAVAAMSGGRQTINYEAQAAIEFMQAGGNALSRPFTHDIIDGEGRLLMAVGPIIRDVALALQNGEDMAEISRRFHRTLILLFLKAVKMARRESGISTVALSGGVFQNQVLFPALVEELGWAGFDVLTHIQLPAGDGCLSLGQAVIGRRSLQ